MLIAFLRSVLLYFILLVTIRLMGKRQIGEMEPTEFLVSMLLANLATIPMQDPALPLTAGLVPILTVLALELILSFLSLRSIRIRKLLCGKPVILIEEGKLLQKNLTAARVTLDELTELLREQGILQLNAVKYAILETNGQVSAILYGKDRPPTCAECGISPQEELLPWTLISDGRVLHANLRLSGRDERWLEKELRRRSCGIPDVMLMTVDRSGAVCLIRKEDPQ